MDSLFQISMSVSIPMIAMIMHHVPTFMEDICACVTLGLLGTERLAQILMSVLKTEMIAMQMPPALIQMDPSLVRVTRAILEMGHTVLILTNVTSLHITVLSMQHVLIMMDHSHVFVMTATQETEQCV